jgi:hypothetical protein
MPHKDVLINDEAIVEALISDTPIPEIIDIAQFRISDLSIKSGFVFFIIITSY